MFNNHCQTSILVEVYKYQEYLLKIGLKCRKTCEKGVFRGRDASTSHSFTHKISQVKPIFQQIYLSKMYTKTI